MYNRNLRFVFSQREVLQYVCVLFEYSLPFRTRAALSCWSKAVDCALSCSGAVDQWDGVSRGSGWTQQRVRQAGVWGCLQAAGLAAKMAQ